MLSIQNKYFKNSKKFVMNYVKEMLVILVALVVYDLFVKKLVVKG
jgi:hypothetical protein